MDDLRARGKPKVGAAQDLGGSAGGSGTAIGHHDGPDHGDRETHWRRQQYCEPGVNIWFGAYFNSGMLTLALREGQAGDRCKSLRFPW